MKRSVKRCLLLFLAVLTAVALLGAGLATYASNEDDKDQSWHYVGSTNYHVTPLSSGTALLTREPDTRVLESFYQSFTDPPATPPETYEALLRKALDMKLLHLDEAGAPILHDISSQPKLIAEVPSSWPIVAMQAEVDGRKVVLPVPFTASEYDPFSLPNQEGILYSSERDLVLLRADGTTQVVTPPLYQGKTYDELAEESIRRFDKNYVFWVGNCLPAKDNRQVVYISNKADGVRFSLFLLDLETREETLLASDPRNDYFLEAWLDETHILCTKSHSQGSSHCIIRTDGKELPLTLSEETPVFLGVRDGLLVYSNPNCDILHFAQFDSKSETFTDLHSIPLDGSFRLRGVDPFSPDGSRFAYLFVPNDDTYQRDLVVVDLDTMTQQVNQTLPVGTKEDTSVLSFVWLDNQTLFTTVAQSIGSFSNQEIYTTWTYHLS